VKTVIGVIGRQGSGKDELVRYLEKKYQVRKIVMGDIVREIARAKNLEPTRENLHRISKEQLSKTGPDAFTEKAVEEIEKADAETCAVSGLRAPHEIDVMRDRFGSAFKLVEVETTHPWVRFERIQKRGARRDTEDFDRFRRHDREEDQIFQMDEAIRKADTTVNNNGTIDLFHENIETEVVGKFLKSGDNRAE